MKKLGETIREERRKLNLTREQHAQSTGLSKSFLSQNERSVAEPSIRTIRKIARELVISVVTLFMDEAETNNYFGHPPSKEAEINKGHSYVKDVNLVQANCRKRFPLPNLSVSYELITPDLNRQIEILHFSLTSVENSGPEPIIDTYGEKCCIVLALLAHKSFSSAPPAGMNSWVKSALAIKTG